MNKNIDETIVKAWSIIEELCQIRLSENMSNKYTIKTKSPKAANKGYKPADWEIDLPHNFPNHLAGLIEQYGAQNIYEAAFSSFTIKFQAEVRRLAETGKNDEEIRKAMQLWRPSEKGLRKIMSDVSNMSPEYKQKLIEKLMQLTTETK